MFHPELPVSDHFSARLRQDRVQAAPGKRAAQIPRINTTVSAPATPVVRGQPGGVARKSLWAWPRYDLYHRNGVKLADMKGSWRAQAFDRKPNQARADWTTQHHDSLTPLIRNGAAAPPCQSRRVIDRCPITL